MAKETEVTVPITALESLIQAVKDTAPVRKVPYSKHEPRTPFAQGKRRKDRARLERVLYLNGYRPQQKLMFDSEITLANRLVQGRFMDNLVMVRLVQSGSPQDPDILYVSFPNKTIEQRFEMARQTGNSLTTLFRRCCEEAGIDTSDVPDVKPPRKRV